MVSEFVTFARKPTLILEDTELTNREKISYVVQLLKFELLLLLVFIPVILLTEKITGIQSDPFGDTLLTYLVVVIFAPILEELLFRYPLRFSKTAIAVAVSVAIFYGLFLFQNYIHVGITIIVSICSILLIRSLLSRYEFSIQRFWQRHFAIIFHVVAAIFGLIHISNYDNVNNYLFAVPLVLSQWLSGYTFGFVRLKFGMKYNMLLHMSWNFITGTELLIELTRQYI